MGMGQMFSKNYEICCFTTPELHWT